MKDREIDKAIALLSSIKQAHEKAIDKIDDQVSEMEKTMLSNPNQSINYRKVEKMKRNALDWDKVINVVYDKISLDDVHSIENSSNQKKVLEYRDLVDFLFSKLNPSQINELRYLCFWKNIKKTKDESSGFFAGISGSIIAVVILIAFVLILIGVVSIIK